MVKLDSPSDKLHGCIRKYRKFWRAGGHDGGVPIVISEPGQVHREKGQRSCVDTIESHHLTVKWVKPRVMAATSHPTHSEYH